MSKDITYCNHIGCENRECERHQCNLKPGEVVSLARFSDCEHYQRFMRELAKQDEADAWAEAKRDMYSLDDNEGSLSYRG
jgi:hypothetical protein